MKKGIRPRRCPKCGYNIITFLKEEFFCEPCDVIWKVPTEDIIDREGRI